MFDKIEQTLRAFGLENIVYEKESKAGMLWSRVYLLTK
jgi:hypothetical protein